jgi:hypothetical protein
MNARELGLQHGRHRQQFLADNLTMAITLFLAVCPGGLDTLTPSPDADPHGLPTADFSEVRL